MKRVVLIGASGFLGSHVLKELKLQGIEVFAVQNKSPLDENEVQLIRGGIRALTKKRIDEIQPDVILHCARPSMPRFRQLGRKMAAAKAYLNNKWLIRQLQESESKPKLLFASGSLMYGNSDHSHNEDSPLHPISYARQYFRGEMPLVNAIRDGSYPIAMLRFPWLLGDGSWFKWFYAENAKKHHAIPGFGDMQNKMEIIDIEDAAKLMLRYANANLNGIFNVFNKPVTQAEFLRLVSKNLKLPIKDHSEIFPRGLEKESIEAFTSNIILSTKYPKILDAYSFSPIQETLKRC